MGVGGMVERGVRDATSEATLSLVLRNTGPNPNPNPSPNPNPTLTPTLTLSQAYAQTPPRVLQYVALF